MGTQTQTHQSVSYAESDGHYDGETDGSKLQDRVAQERSSIRVILVQGPLGHVSFAIEYEISAGS